MNDYTNLIDQKPPRNYIIYYVIVAVVVLFMASIIYIAFYLSRGDQTTDLPNDQDNSATEQISEEDVIITDTVEALQKNLETYYAANDFYPPDNHIEYLWSGNRMVMATEPSLPAECGQINTPTDQCGITYVSIRDNQGYYLEVKYLTQESELIKEVKEPKAPSANKSPGNTPSPGNTSPKISPILFDELTGYPGEEMTLMQSISNPGTSAMNLTVTTQNFLPAQGNFYGVPELTDQETEYALKNWISYDQPEITVQPGETIDFKFHLAIPSNAPAGGRYGSLLFNTSASTNPDDPDALSIQSGVGSLILLKVLGDDLVESGYVQDVSISSSNSKSYDIQVQFTNNGNVHLYPTGTIDIYDLQNELLTQIPLTSENILPESSRLLTTTWKPSSGIPNLSGYHLGINGTYGLDSISFSFQKDL